MSFNNTGLNGLTLDVSTILAPIGSLTVVGSVGTDFILPENVSDSEKILKSDCEIKIDEIFAGNGMITARGTACFNLLLLGEDGRLGSVRTSESFELKDVLEGVDDSSLLVYGGSEGECNCRLVNPRKLNLTADVSVNVFAMSEHNAVPNIKGTETIEDEMRLKRKQGSVDYMLPYSLSEKSIPVSHDINLDGNYPPMSEMIFSNVKVAPFEVKSVGNNVIVKSKAIFSGIYRSEEGNIFAIEKPFTLEKTLEADNADAYEWFANAVADDLTAEIAIDSYGDAKLIELDFNYDIILNGVRNISVDTVTDAYSTEYECNNAVAYAESAVYKRTYGSSLSVNASAEREGISAENVRAIMLGNVNIKDMVTEYSDEKKRLVTEATAVISAVCENNITSDTDPRYSSVVFEYPFKCELDIGEISANTDYNISVSVTDTRFRCDQNKIYCDFENTIRAVVSEKVAYGYLTEMCIDKNAPIITPYAPITLCYPSGGETLWDIAKYYKVTTDGIIASNNLESENISDKKVLLIPSYRKAKPSYAKVN